MKIINFVQKTHEIKNQKFCIKKCMELKHFMKKSMDVNVEKRSTAAMLLMHPFIRKACSREEFAKFARVGFKG